MKDHPVDRWAVLYKSGTSYSKIAAAFGVTKGVVAGALCRHRGGPAAKRKKRTETRFVCGHGIAPGNVIYNGKYPSCATCQSRRMKLWYLRKAGRFVEAARLEAGFKEEDKHELGTP